LTTIEKAKRAKSRIWRSNEAARPDELNTSTANERWQ